MFKNKFVISISLFITFLVFTSTIKNKTRVLEKKISNLNTKILLKNKDLNEENTSKLPAKKGLAYLLNTDIFHRGYMKPNSKRLAFVIEFINFNKMRKIDGLSDACHFNEDVSKIEFE